MKLIPVKMQQFTLEARNVQQWLRANLDVLVEFRVESPAGETPAIISLRASAGGNRLCERVVRADDPSAMVGAILALGQAIFHAHPLEFAGLRAAPARAALNDALTEAFNETYGQWAGIGHKIVK